jgi:hypothetical protein
MRNRVFQNKERKHWEISAIRGPTRAERVLEDMKDFR